MYGRTVQVRIESHDAMSKTKGDSAVTLEGRPNPTHCLKVSICMFKLLQELCYADSAARELFLTQHPCDGYRKAVNFILTGKGCTHVHPFPVSIKFTASCKLCRHRLLRPPVISHVVGPNTVRRTVLRSVVRYGGMCHETLKRHSTHKMCKNTIL